MKAKGGDRLGYSVKWVVENLGITRDMLRYYEKEKLIPIDETRNPLNKYRDYSEEDIERIWAIKLLIGIGFSAKEIRSFGDDPKFNFYDAISKKVDQLENRYNEILSYLGFAKTIKMTGRIPNTKQLGKMKFDDFIKYARENWNALNGSHDQKYMALVDSIIDKPAEEWDNTDLQRLMDFYGNIEPEQLLYVQTIAGYYRVIVDMMPLGYTHEVVQSVVNCLYEYMLKGIEPQNREKFTRLYFTDHSISSFIESGFAEMNERNYGKDGCLFIANALAHYGGYAID